VSTILKALRRLEEDKARGGAPRPLREEVASGPRERPRRGGAPWALLGALVFGGGLGASAWWFWPYERAAEPVEVAAAPAAIAPAAAPDDIAPAAAPDDIGAPSAPAEAPAYEADTPLTAEQLLAQLQGAGSDEPADLSDDALESLVEVVERPPAMPRIAPVEPTPAVAAPAAPERRVAVARKRTPESEPAAGSVRPAAAPRAAAPEPTAPSPSIRPAAETSPRPPIASAPAPVVARPAPAQRAVPDDERDWPVTSEWQEEPAKLEPSRIEAPRSTSGSSPVSTAGAADVKVKRTQWHPERVRRSAEIVLAGKDRSVHEGDVIGDYVVSEIRPSGVVLSRDGEQIERGIGK